MRPLAAPYLDQLIPYVPGKPIEETEREFGVANIAKLASNENSLGPSPRAMRAIELALAKSH
ncbi:MAG TPA: histidinol-phosphate transaminase, partial [Myxococcota bacterium]